MLNETLSTNFPLSIRSSFKVVLRHLLVLHAVLLLGPPLKNEVVRGRHGAERLLWAASLPQEERPLHCSTTVYSADRHLLTLASKHSPALLWTERTRMVVTRSGEADRAILAGSPGRLSRGSRAADPASTGPEVAPAAAERVVTAAADP